MVTIINFKERNKEDGTSFFVLAISGGIEMLLSQKTGNYYATIKKAYLSCTFDELTCQSLIGSEIPGMIEKQECTPYEYTVKDTGEVLFLTHRYTYVPESNSPVPQNKSTIQQRNSSYSQREVAKNNAFSQNEEVLV